MKLPVKVRDTLEALANYVEHHKEGTLRAQNHNFFNLSQAETYQRWYCGYKREVQEQSLDAGTLISSDDPLYGWGWIADHDPQIRLVGAGQLYPIDAVGAEYKAQTLTQKQSQSAELFVIKRSYIVPTLSMQLIHATITPTLITGLTLSAVRNRLKRLKTQLTNPGLIEQLAKLHCYATSEGIEVSLSATRNELHIGPLTN